MRLLRPLLSTVLLSALAALPSRAARLDLNTATTAELQAAYAAGLTAEKVVAAYLARIEAYDKKGPRINAVITLNPRALAEAKALDAELRAKGPRSPLHGVPVLLKDNVDTFDLPTTGGSQLLEGSLPPDDAFITKKLRAAGAIILAKVNLSEWAGSGGSASGAPPEILKAGFIPGGFSSAGGQTRNPHALDRSPSGSSGGTGAALAAGFGHLGIGSDTGGSIRGPAAFNGITGLKPTRGLMSRDGVIPLGLSFDTAGPMARNVHDLAAMLGPMTGIDPADPATLPSGGHYHADYTLFLKKGSLKGARLGVNRDYLGQDPEVDRIFEASLAKLRELGAELEDPVSIPEYLRRARADLYNVVVRAEFKADLTTYLGATRPGLPKTFADIVRLSNAPATGYRSPGKAAGLAWVSSPGVTLDLDDPVYLATRQQILPALTATLEALMAKHRLDAIIYPTMPVPALLINPPDGVGWPDSATAFANFTGWPDVIVPAGMTPAGLPVTLSFLGRAWTEPALLGFAYDFEQATQARVLPKHTPALPTDILVY